MPHVLSIFVLVVAAVQGYVGEKLIFVLRVNMQRNTTRVRHSKQHPAHTSGRFLSRCGLLWFRAPDDVAVEYYAADFTQLGRCDLGVRARFRDLRCKLRQQLEACQERLFSAQHSVTSIHGNPTSRAFC